MKTNHKIIIKRLELYQHISNDSQSRGKGWAFYHDYDVGTKNLSVLLEQSNDLAEAEKNAKKWMINKDVDWPIEVI